MTFNDVDALVELYAAIAAADHPEWTETREEIEEELHHSWIDLAADSVIAEADGEIVATGLQIATPDPETIVRSIAFGGVRPSHRGRGIGLTLTEWHRARGRQQLAASDLDLPGWLMFYVDERNTSQMRLADRLGLPLVRYFTKMERDLALDIPDLALPDGLELAIPTAADSARILDAKNNSFRDHWGSQPSTEEGWNSMMGQPTSRFDLSVIALEGDTVVGFVMTQVNPDDFVLQGYAGGYIPLVGVTRAWRRKGVAPALLAAAFRLYRAEGHEKVSLDVDSENPSGALSLYTGMGFVPDTRSVAFVEEF
ncbi:GNAT family N-acetyltransferase [Pseudolysinimonas sp.]|uniref:GNAT family N-acetyltransferase n=1 Tax=Pseudolysinimonas sp. TaxID=2680009 RepID=UPI00286C4EF4|nr:GNAT family N-acetyltransferase [Pseudolysinimonas sp.]